MSQLNQKKVCFQGYLKSIAMPIKPENRVKYPKNWNEISADIRFRRANNKCEVCGVLNYSEGFWIDNKFATVTTILNQLNETGKTQIDDLPMEIKSIKIVLTVAHLDHNPQNCDYNNLKAMCQRCHNRYDARHRAKIRKLTGFKDQLIIKWNQHGL
jgi:hypothetical protein